MKKILCFIILFFFWITAGNAIVLEDVIKNGELEKTLLNKKVGYYIGSFDPIHLGHENFAESVLDQRLCDYVLIYPAWGGDEYKNRTDLNIRMEMVFKVFANHPKVIVTRMNPRALQNALMEDSEDQDLGGKPSVKSKIVGMEYVGMVGSDSAIEGSKNIKWLSIFMQGIKIPERYKENTIGGIMAIPVSSFIVGLRAGDSLDFLNGKIGDRPIIRVIDAKQKGNSSTQIRTRLKSKIPVSDLLNSEVEKIINQYNLYQE